jgi:dolichyl-phosphate-mannose--protein O-mannosyl transferase
LDIHLRAAKFHDDLLAVDESKDDKKAHPYQSRPWEWIWLGRPVAYYYETLNEKKPDEVRQEVLGIGNPAVFWGGMVAIPWLGVAMVRRRDWVAGFILAAFLAQWLFWFIPGISLQKVQFFFYATPLAPFLVLGVTYVLRDLSRIRLAGSRSRPFLPVAVGWVGLAVALFVFFWPVLTGGGLSPDSWQARIWSGDWV